MSRKPGGDNRQTQRDDHAGTAWWSVGQVRDEVSCLDSIGDVMRQALDVLEGKWSDSRQD